MFSAVLVENIRDVKRASCTIDTSQLAVVIANLVFMHDVIVASEQLLIEAARSTERMLRSSFHVRLAKYYRSHLEEERDHAQWMRDDLKSVGVAPELPNKLAVAMAGSQYYLLKHEHPAALLGYMATLEGDPVPVEVIESLEHAHGKQLLRCARMHAIKDLEHRKELFAVIDDTPDSLLGLISYSADNTLDYMVQATRTWGEGKGVI
jgi:hypothetical protein